MSTPPTILRVDASPRGADSVSRQLGDELIAGLLREDPSAKVVSRDVAGGYTAVDADWIGANFTDDAARTAEQRAKLAGSDELVAELQSAGTLVITTPIYNFGIPAALKSWIDLIARARLTFRYTASGPVGLLEGKRAFIVVTSGGTPIGSDIDFATGYLKHILGFVGIKDVTVVDAGGLGGDADAIIAGARRQIATFDSLETQEA
ncbi:MAG: NAD(P)H-dependent oxidoreductase [Filomicrobium sp.]